MQLLPQPFQADVVLARGKVPARLAGAPVAAEWVAGSVVLVAYRSAPGRPRNDDLAAFPLEFRGTAPRRHLTSVPSLAMDGRAWLASYEERLDEINERAQQAQRELAGVEATATSPDGAVTVTTDPAGELRSLVLGEAAERLTREQLAAAVLGTAGRARAEAAQLAAAAVAPLLGEGTTGMSLLRSHLPGTGTERGSADR
ncbi:YbaB/EbfC family nucleoid-associated protein [Pseudonocardia aurantiaca]|uniref:YbaB/EbfC family nucleoid-associated protein n=1 Tax=Pseudonocardia aurantiaca TaxID=75290 RepID=A0ABW4FS59_9PSEU